MTRRAHERLKARLWIKVYIAVVAHPTMTVESAKLAADMALRDFDAAFIAESDNA